MYRPNKLLTPEIIIKRANENKIKKAKEYDRIKKEKIDKMIQSCEDKFISKICELFINRWDCYAIQDHENPLLFPTVYQDLTLDIIKDSINPNANITIGIHQISDNKVKWLCYDVDKKHTQDPKLLTDQIIKYLKEWHNLHGYLEPSGSPDSYHVWIFIEPTDVNTVINFHNTFKNRLKSVGIDTKPIEKGISRGYKNLGCMIKLPFNIQRKTNKRSELLSDIFSITQDRLPTIGHQTIDNPIIGQHIIDNTVIQKVSQQEQPRCQTIGWWLLCKGIPKRTKHDIFENVDMCENIISKMPEIMKWVNWPDPDRSKLDFMIIKALVKVGISKKTIYKYLQTFPSSKTKIYEKGYSYFELTYNSVIKANNKSENEWHVAWKKAALKLGMRIEARLDVSRSFVADIYDPKRKIVTEVQHASIPPETIMNRCSFYESNGIKIRWIFDYREKYDTNNLRLRIDESHKENIFIWQICPRNIQCLFNNIGNPKYDVYFNIEYDFSDDTHTTLKIERMSEDGSGYGRLYSSIHKPEMIQRQIKQVPFGHHNKDMISHKDQDPFCKELLS